MNKASPSKPSYIASLEKLFLICTALPMFIAAAHAQGMPGGMGGGGMPGNMRQPQLAKPASADDFIVPNPLYVWHAKMQSMRGTLGLTPPQSIAFEDFLTDLSLTVKFNERQVWRVLGRSRVVVSAVANPERDLSMAKEDAQDAAKTLDDLTTHYAKLMSILDAQQKQLIVQSYGESLTASFLPKKAPFGGVPATMNPSK
jgi:hypothetical protein